MEARLASQDMEIARNPILRGQLNPSKNVWRFPWIVSFKFSYFWFYKFIVYGFYF